MESTGVACVWLLDPPVCAGRHLPREHSPGARAGPWGGTITSAVWLCHSSWAALSRCLSLPELPVKWVCEFPLPGVVSPGNSGVWSPWTSAGPEGTPHPQPWSEKHLPCPPPRCCPSFPPARPRPQEWPALGTERGKRFTLFTWTPTLNETGRRSISPRTFRFEGLVSHMPG